MFNKSARSDLELMIGKDEHILWRGRPDKLCYILEGILNPMLPLALVWLLFDSMFIAALVSSAKNGTTGGSPLYIMSVFLFLHLMPVWIYLIGALFVFRRYKHTEYIVTEKGVYISGGVFAYTCHMKPYTEVSHIDVHRGIVDQYLHVGDVVLTSMTTEPIRGTQYPMGCLTIADIRGYQDVFEMIKKLQTDIFSDTMYPNDLRPKENHGYETKYKGLQNLD